MKRWGAAWLLAGTPALAQAHALPVGLELAWPASGAPVVLTNRGVVIDAQLRCNESYGVNTSAYPRLWLGETMVIATQNSVLRSPDRGCTLVHATGLPDRSLSGFSAGRGVLLVTTLTAELGGGVYASADQGASFTRWADNEPYEAFRELMFAPGDAMRVYASGFRVEPASGRVSYVWAVSRDGGRTFSRSSIADERLVLAVSARDADVVWAWDSQTGSVFASRDAGKTFAERLRFQGKPSLTLSGSFVWAGSEADEGLRVSRDDGETFTTILPELTAVTCLSTHEGTLHVCGVRYPLQLGIWSLVEGADTGLREELMFEDVAQQVACAEPTTCEQPWQDWSLELLSNVDAGVPDASVADTRVVDAGVDAGVVDARSSGCSTRAGSGGWLLWLLACLGVSVARRR
ncbi:MAG: hypothetical protein ABW352_15260 [Polyangiales bacterium]